jgi:hypothetical protein
MAFLGQQNSGVYAPADVERKRRLAEMLAGKDIVSQEPFGALAEGLIGARSGYESQQASEAEQRGIASANQSLAEMLSNPNVTVDQLIGESGMGNPWANGGQQAIIAQLLGQKMTPAAPYEPDWQTFETPEGDVMRFDNNASDAQPSMLFDAPTPGPEFQTLGAEEVSTLGLPPGSYQRGRDGKISQIGSGPMVEVNTGDNSSKFVDEADKLAAGRLSEVVTQGQNAQQFMGDIQTLAEISKTLNTGKGAQVLAALGPYAEMAGINMEGLGEAQAYEAIISRMAPQMRQPGSGASSDFDAKQFLKSLPSLGNSPEGNVIVQQTFTAIQQAKMQAAEIASMALSGQITWQEADKQIAAIGDPFTAFNEYRKKSEGGDKGGGDGWKEIAPGVRIRKKSD